MPAIRVIDSFFAQLCRLWKEQILNGKEEGDVIAVNGWLARATLDVIGQSTSTFFCTTPTCSLSSLNHAHTAAYHFDFGALEDSQNEISEAYSRLFSDAPTEPIASVDMFAATWRWYPRRIRELIEYIPVEELQRIRRSIVRANMSENSSLQLSKNEMVSQMAALTIAGHETTANTLTWLLWELAKHPRFQEQLREEIRQKRKEISVRVGEGVDFKLEDLESMPFLQAVLKVRFLADTAQ